MAADKSMHTFLFRSSIEHTSLLHPKPSVHVAKAVSQPKEYLPHLALNATDQRLSKLGWALGLCPRAVPGGPDLQQPWWHCHPHPRNDLPEQMETAEHLHKDW